MCIARSFRRGSSTVLRRAGKPFGLRGRIDSPRENASRPLDWSARSRRDLLLIDAFYAQFGSPTAMRVVAAILDTAMALAGEIRVGPAQRIDLPALCVKDTQVFWP